jgi:molybdenum cofactor synthesis domain-containing protein
MAATATAGVILIGDEILSGKTADQNARLLITELRELGVALRRIVVIPDVVEEIATAVGEHAARYDHVFTSGGVGPTHDDLTMEGVARAFSSRVIHHPELERLLRLYYGERLGERHLRMAEVPEGAELVAGSDPSWPVVAMRNVYILPGIPEIFARKFRAIRERFRQSPYHLRCIFTSDEEGIIASELDRIVASYPDLQVGSYPLLSGADYKVKVTLESKDVGRVEEATRALVEALGSAVVRVT